MKDNSGKTLKEIAETSNIPLSTVQKILNGETQNPNAEAVYHIVKAMGFNMEELYDESKPRGDIDEDSISLIRQMYKERITEIKEQHNEYIDELRATHERLIKTYKRIINIMSLLLAVLFFLFLIYFALDYADQTWGIFFREGLNRQALATTINIISAP